MRSALRYIAVVHNPGAVLFVTVAASPADRERQLAEYVRRQASQKLGPRTRVLVQSLLDSGEPVEAIRKYFEAVGDEWEHEWLHLEAAPGHASAPAVHRSSYPAMLVPRPGRPAVVRAMPVVRVP